MQERGKRGKPVKGKKLESAAAALCLALLLAPVAAFAPQEAHAGETGDFTVEGGAGGEDYDYSDHVLTIKTSTQLTIGMATPGATTTTDRIVVTDGVSAYITLAGVKIDMSGTGNSVGSSTWAGVPAFEIASDSSGNVTVILADGSVNVLKGGYQCAGLQKNGIPSNGTAVGTLTIKGGMNGTGFLSATGGTYGAGIGGGFPAGASGITIVGGVVTATGGNESAGIGGGSGGSGSAISITDGKVVAICSARYGAGIGGGYEGDGSNIVIDGGTVTAAGGLGAAGIGGGCGGRRGGTGSGITITGGIVTATGGSKAPGIGGGVRGTCSGVKITGGSVRAVGTPHEDKEVPAIGSGLREGDNPGNPVTPTLADGTTSVYLLEVEMDGTSIVTIDGTVYPAQHVYYEDGEWRSENKIYVYLTNTTNHKVKVGGAERSYHIDSRSQVLHLFESDYTSNSTGHWHACSVDGCTEQKDYAVHTYEWQDGDGQYWQKCSVCGHETAKKGIPSITIMGADAVCVGHDYSFSVALGEGLSKPSAGYGCGLGGQLGMVASGDGSCSATIGADMYKTGYENGERVIAVTASAETSDGYEVSVTKEVAIQSEHAGGTANCMQKAVCSTCGDEYGELGAHSLTHVAAKEATADVEGNIEYWRCETCGKLFSDAQGKSEITLADTVVKKLQKSDAPEKTAKTGDSVNVAFWLTLLSVASVALAVACIRNVRGRVR